jgi:MoaA/NifB/PqqE/SkfB family radical SAM enzyme
VIDRARELGAFRFNTGQLMRIGTAARQWERLAPRAGEYEAFRAMLAEQARRIGSEMEFCYAPFALEDALRGSLQDPPATLLVLPNGWVKVAAVLPHICSDLRRSTLAEAWLDYRSAWRDEAVRGAVHRASLNDSRHADANAWRVETGVYG